MAKAMRGFTFALAALVCGTGLMSNARAQSPAASQQDVDALIGHVYQIFDAFIEQDRDRIKNLHTEDWVGFLGPSTQIERGIDAYMVNADRSLDSFKGTSYEIHDTEVQIFGDVALVFYVATYYYEKSDTTTGEVPLRSVDVFRRENGEWIQSASHISVIPAAGRWGEGESNHQSNELD
jgi:ketosteroid isomerase-like protein